MKTKRVMFFFLLFLIVLMIGVSLTQGSQALTLAELLRVLTFKGTAAQQLLIFDFRLPRIALAILAGAAFGISGAVLQSVTQNPLADTGILGINAGAGFAVLLFTSFVQVTTTATFLLPFVALLGALLAAGLIFKASYQKKGGIVPIKMVLTGVVIGAGFSALTLLLTTRLSAERFRFVTLWQAGSIWGSNWAFVLALLPWLVVVFPLIFKKHRVLDILQLGDDVATSVGVAVKQERFKLLCYTVFLAGAAVSVTGGIYFLGLLAPHIARQLGIKRHFALLPFSALIGSCLLLGADTLGRLLTTSSEIPAGMIVAILGAPYFLYLMAKTRA